VVKRNAFLALPNAQNGGELKGRVKSGRLKSQFSRGREFGFTRDP
jgi:hypothetical protein